MGFPWMYRVCFTTIFLSQHPLPLFVGNTFWVYKNHLYNTYTAYTTYITYIYYIYNIYNIKKEIPQSRKTINRTTRRLYILLITSSFASHIRSQILKVCQNSLTASLLSWFGLEGGLCWEFFFFNVLSCLSPRNFLNVFSSFK